MATPSKIADILLRAKLLDDLQMRSALAHQSQWGGRLAKVVVEKRFAKEPAVVDAIAKALNLPRVELDKIEKDPSAISRVDVTYCKEKAVFPCALKDGGKTLWVAMADPTDIGIADELALKTKTRVKAVVAGEMEILAAIDRHYLGKEQVHRQVPGAIEDMEEDADEFKIVDMTGKTVMKKLSDIKPPEPKPAAPTAERRAAMKSAIDELFDGPPAPAAPQWSAADVARLEAIRANQEKGTKILRALVDLCFEKGVFSREEYKAKLPKA